MTRRITAVASACLVIGIVSVVFLTGDSEYKLPVAIVGVVAFIVQLVALHAEDRHERDRAMRARSIHHRSDQDLL